MASWLDKYMTAPAAKSPRPQPEFVIQAPPGDPQAQRYAQGALKRAADNIAFAPKGTRNDTLNKESWSIGGLVLSGHLDYEEALNTLNNAAIEAGLDQTEIDRTVPRAIRQGEPRTVELDPTMAPQPVSTTGIEFQPQAGQEAATGQLGGGEDDTREEAPPTTEEQRRQAAELRWEADLLAEKRRLALQEEAKRSLRREQLDHTIGTITPPMPMDEFQAIDFPPTQWVLDGLQPVGTRALLAAQAKSGKTTMVTNLVKSLADGDNFLGQFMNQFTADGKKITVIDDELDDRMLQRWYKKISITNPHRIGVKTLRGRLQQFNITDDMTRARWAEALQGTDYLVLDCLRPVLDANGLDENREAGIFLNAFDALLAEAGIENALVVHHMGHTSNRSRGDSRIMDWPDSLWKLTREDTDNPASKRYFEAFGREVDFRQAPVDYNKDSGVLTVQTGPGGRAGGVKKATDPVSWIIETWMNHGEGRNRGKAWFENEADVDKSNQQYHPGRNELRRTIDKMNDDGMLEKLGTGYRPAMNHDQVQAIAFPK